MISITLNGEHKTLKKGQTLAMLLNQCGYRLESIAVAVNETVVPRAQYSERFVSHGDRIEILTAMQGG